MRLARPRAARHPTNVFERQQTHRGALLSIRVIGAEMNSEVDSCTGGARSRGAVGEVPGRHEVVEICTLCTATQYKD